MALLVPTRLCTVQAIEGQFAGNFRMDEQGLELRAEIEALADARVVQRV